MSNAARFHWNLSRTSMMCGVEVTSSYDEYWTEEEVKELIAPGGQYAGFTPEKLTGLALFDW